jgi:hypothetical protein
MGFFSVAYDIFVIGLIAALFSFYLPLAVPRHLLNVTFVAACQRRPDTPSVSRGRLRNRPGP